MRKFLTFFIASAVTTSVVSAKDLYLMGYNNIWDVQENLKFVPSEVENVYSLHVGTLDGNSVPYGLKIALVNDDAEHTWAQEWGTAQGEKVVIDTPFGLADGYDNDGDNNNIYLPNHYGLQNISELHGATLILDLDKSTLLIDPDMYIAGECTNWNNNSAAWRFTNEGNGVHTLSVKNINGNFKIAAGAKEAWTVEYGGSQNMQPGNTYALIPGPGNDMSVNGSFNKIILDRINNTITFDNDGSGSTDPVTPPNPNERGPELYLMGEWNNWSPNQEPYHFIQNNINEYVLEVASLSGEFKVTTSNWEEQFGCNTPLEIGQTYSCVLASNGSNMTLSQGTGTNVKITFDYKNRTIQVDCMPALYLVGEFNNWTPTQNYQFSLIDGKYVLRTKNFSGEFRIETMDQAVKFGSAIPGSLESDSFYGLQHNSEANLHFAGLNNADNRVLITLDPEYNGIPTNASTPIADDLLEEGNVEYYNLQGLRVNNPQNGIFIRKSGKKTQKVIIK